MTPLRASRRVVKARSWMAPHPATGNPVQVVSGQDYWDLLRRYEALMAAVSDAENGGERHG